jgi:hypothetical protein
MIERLFLVLNTRFTSLNSACISFTLNQVHSLVRIYHRAMLVHLWASILRGDGPLSSHVVSISPVTSRTILFYLSKGTSLLTIPDNRLYWRPLLWKKAITTQLWNMKVLFFLWHSIKSLDQEDRIMKCNTSRVMKHNPIRQGAISPTHERPRSFPPLHYLDIPLPPRSMCPSLFLVLSTSLRKSRDEISFKGGGL